MVDLLGAGSPSLPEEPVVEPAAGEAASRPLEQLVARLLKDWERTVAVAIGIITLTAALLTYVAVRQDDAAAEARGQATLETLQVQRQKLVAAVRVDAEANAANRYLRSIAEAEAMESQATAAQSAGNGARAAQLRAEALVLRTAASAYRETTFDLSRMIGTSSFAIYDTEHRLATIKGYEAFEALPSEQSTHTVSAAEARHAQSIRTMLAVVVLLMLVLLLTVGRVLRPEWRTTVLTSAVTGFVVAAAAAGINAGVGG